MILLQCEISYVGSRGHTYLFVQIRGSLDYIADITERLRVTDTLSKETTL